MTTKKRSAPRNEMSLLEFWLRYIGFQGAGHNCPQGEKAARYLRRQLREGRISNTQVWNDAPMKIKTGLLDQFDIDIDVLCPKGTCHICDTSRKRLPERLPRPYQWGQGTSIKSWFLRAK